MKKYQKSKTDTLRKMSAFIIITVVSLMLSVSGETKQSNNVSSYIQSGQSEKVLKGSYSQTNTVANNYVVYESGDNESLSISNVPHMENIYRTDRKVSEKCVRVDAEPTRTCEILGKKYEVPYSYTKRGSDVYFDLSKEVTVNFFERTDKIRSYLIGSEAKEKAYTVEEQIKIAKEMASQFINIDEYKMIQEAAGEDNCLNSSDFLFYREIQGLKTTDVFTAYVNIYGSLICTASHLNTFKDMSIPVIDVEKCKNLLEIQFVNLFKNNEECKLLNYEISPGLLDVVGDKKLALSYNIEYEIQTPDKEPMEMSNEYLVLVE